MGGGEDDMNAGGAGVEIPLLRIEGASPADHRYYTLVLFDIADSKKCGRLIKNLKR